MKYILAAAVVAGLLVTFADPYLVWRFMRLVKGFGFGLVVGAGLVYLWFTAKG